MHQRCSWHSQRRARQDPASTRGSTPESTTHAPINLAAEAFSVRSPAAPPPRARDAVRARALGIASSARSAVRRRSLPPRPRCRRGRAHREEIVGGAAEPRVARFSIVLVASREDRGAPSSASSLAMLPGQLRGWRSGGPRAVSSLTRKRRLSESRARRWRKSKIFRPAASMFVPSARRRRRSVNRET